VSGQKHLIRSCSIWRALEVVGDTPTLLILEAAFLGARRFDDFWRETRLFKALLSDRLKKLVEAGLMEKMPYQERPLRFRYRLSGKGRDLYPVALALLQWEKDWGDADAGARTIRLVHKPCGAEFRPTPACGSCGDAIDATRVDWQEGPGVGWMPPIYSRRRQLREQVGEGSLLFREAAQLMGDRWAGLILRALFTDIRSFDGIRADAGMATNILSERLQWLTARGVIRHLPIEGQPGRHEYRLTRKGVSWYPALLMLMVWGDRYYVSPAGPPLLLTHRDCGGPLNPRMVCSNCGEPLEAHDVEFSFADREAALAEAG
jgi:DNA-binding HxlR family transcriptional regulator